MKSNVNSEDSPESMKGKIHFIFLPEKVVFERIIAGRFRELSILQKAWLGVAVLFWCGATAAFVIESLVNGTGTVLLFIAGFSILVLGLFFIALKRSIR